jgi:hypothetical protein
MKTVPLSVTTQEALSALKEMYKEGKVFDKNKAVYRNAELDTVISTAIENIGKDTKKFLNITHNVEITGDILFNMKAIVRTCGICVCDYTLWDSDAGTCTYIGSLVRPGCTTA